MYDIKLQLLQVCNNI